MEEKTYCSHCENLTYHTLKEVIGNIEIWECNECGYSKELNLKEY